ncbi:hypothetical protein [Microseira sp. BLCC-F43]|uniref:hypothetical protein n=1 Tax=Microseira sp. BLCC-F43 TaxID=3153602 RepID=UPI0035B7B486
MQLSSLLPEDYLFQDLRASSRFLRKIVGLATRDMPPFRYAKDGRNRVSGNALANTKVSQIDFCKNSCGVGILPALEFFCWRGLINSVSEASRG